MADSRLDLIAELQDKASKKLEALSGQVNNLSKNVANSGKSMDTMGKKTQKLGMDFDDMRDKMGQIGIVSAGALATMGVALNGAVQKFSEAQSAQRGFEATSKKVGASITDLNNAVQRLTADGLLPVTTAQAALQNLMQAGMTDVGQMTMLMQNFKDEAIFGKSASIDYATAVSNLSESFKTESSTLGNLSGISENYGMILEKGAAAMGKNVSQLTEAERVQAKYLGLLQVGQISAGNAALAIDTLAGAQARATKTTTELQIAIGSALEPALTSFYNIITPLLQQLEDWIKKNPEITQQVILFTGAVLGMGAALGVAALALSPMMILFAKFVVACAAVAAAVSLLRAGWDSDFMGMRTTLIAFFETVSATFAEIQMTISFHLGYISAFLVQHRVQVEATWVGMLEVLKTHATNVWNVIAFIPKTALDMGLTLIRSAMKLLRGDWQGALGELWEIAKRFWNNVYETFILGSANIVSSVVKAAASVIASFEGWPAQAMKIGESFINGIVQGIQNAVGGAISAARNAASSIASSFTSAIGGLRMPGFADGGIVQRFASGGMASGTDTVPAMLTPGEVILNASQQKNLAGQLRGGSKGATLTININTMIGDDEYVEKLGAKILGQLKYSTSF